MEKMFENLLKHIAYAVTHTKLVSKNNRCALGNVIYLEEMSATKEVDNTLKKVNTQFQ